MTESLKLPVGIEDFAEIRQAGFYYIDKTKFIEQLLDGWGKVNLFTRPRRFGKTLNMSMLRYFFEIGADASLFDGLQIAENKKLCEEFQGKYPVLFLSFKNVEGLTFADAQYRLTELIAGEAERFAFLAQSDKLTENEKSLYRGLTAVREGRYALAGEVLASALQTLSKLLAKHYGQKTVMLLDEYDVPLDKAFQNGYYQEMVALIRGMLGQALKTNEFLQFAVLTGCLRVSKESIFTGLNNFKVLSITDNRFDEQFGFTDTEVKQLLAAYNLADHLEETKAWYDGYRFGAADVYCPWDVINHVDVLRSNPLARPQAYWINTSGNALVKRFIDMADKSTRSELERLVAGEAIEKHIRLELTYDEIDSSIDNLWSVLFTTGYLTQQGMTESGAYKLVIPNQEIREVYRLQIQEWFKKSIFANTAQLESFWQAFAEGDSEAVELFLNRTLSNSISVFDAKGRDAERENSYHMLLVGLLAGKADWLVRSNVEAGEGFADIIVETDDLDAGVIVELKYAPTMAALEKSCAKALAQIHERRYAEFLRNNGREKIFLYGMSFCKKRCKVVVEKL
ncbi:AAA family ATPase [uncultured Phascolarctobacterium sp.]|uniref:AAA family ATPase n=1 Tax=uncultured Phascolarctobacterium sp. TaxID=512296 RepID=UPI002627A32A|nr:AAA family ATPase [uncultured Phascolarctobacterium sp.]